MKYGDDIDTDGIYPGRYLNLTDPVEMARHAMEGVDPDFLSKVREGRDIIVAGRNFGCGSSRDQAATSLRYAGISAIIADSFSRIFYRNAVNQGILVLVAPGLHDMVEDLDEVEVDVLRGAVKNLVTGKTFKAKALPSFVLEIIEDGGLIPHLKKRSNKLEEA